MAEELFWVTYNELKFADSGFFNGSRNYPGVPHCIQG
jgi:hypothetical protein